MKCRVLECGNCFITQHYGNNGHLGVDIVANIDGEHRTDYVVAHSSGKVIDIATGHGNEPGSTGMASYGNYVQIQHDDGYTTFYAHLDSVYVSVGECVDKGQRIGYMGNTGNSYGAHLHFEVRKNASGSSRVNPEPYLDSDLPNMYSVEYRVYCNGRWFNTTNNGGTAGNLKNEIGGYQIKTFNGAGKTYYKCHIKNKGWLDSVDKWDDSEIGYAGIKEYPKIDAITMWSEHGDLTYRVHYNGQWSEWVKGKYGTEKGEYAGIIGKTIDGLEIKFS